MILKLLLCIYMMILLREILVASRISLLSLTWVQRGVFPKGSCIVSTWSAVDLQPHSTLSFCLPPCSAPGHVARYDSLRCHGFPGPMLDKDHLESLCARSGPRRKDIWSTSLGQTYTPSLVIPSMSRMARSCSFNMNRGKGSGRTRLWARQELKGCSLPTVI